MNKIILFAMPILCAMACTAPAVAASTDRPEIRAVVESFRTAIIQRDKPRFLALFVKPDLPWQSVLSDASLARVRAGRPQAAKTAFDASLTPAGFIDFVVGSKASSEETFANVRIDGDADVATVTFDYTFLADGRATNSGKECWLLVRSSEGWKITTLAYSVVLAPKD